MNISLVVPRRPLLAAVVALLLAAAMLVALSTARPVLPAAHAADPCGPQGNEIACENSKPGTPMAQWDDFYGSGDETIQGFPTDISVDRGNRIDFKIDTDASSYSIQIFRTGWYGGDGARLITTIQPSASLPQQQPQCLNDVTTELYDCGNWAVSASWNVPSTAVSGVYVARLERADTGGSSHIVFIVRDDSSHSDVVFQTSDTTWQAYNAYGGSNFYWGGANGRAYKVSYNRPITTRSDVPWGRDFYFANEFPMVRFLERNGYDVSYVAGLDTHRSGQLLTNHQTFLSVGHDEYWSGQQRSNVVAARDAGVNLQFLAGNDMYWRTRFEKSIDASQTPNRTLVTYKETWANEKIDPATEWTGTWRDPRYAPRSAGGGSPENEVIGTAYLVNHDDLALTVGSREGKTRLWRNTDLASLSAGQSRVLAPHTIGYESNEVIDNGFSPPGLIRLSETTGATPEYLQDFGNTVAPGTTTHHLTLYRATSGALVFSAGSVQWSWGLDATHDTPYTDDAVDARMQQAQVNLLADMGAQPTTLMSGLVATTASADTTGPSVTISSPAAGSTQANGTAVTLSGTASDSGGGVVAGVEVSTDGGSTWQAATGTTSWSYAWSPTGEGSVPVRVRAIDDSANIGTAASRSFSVTCPCSVFGTQVPKTPAADDTSAAELGLRFTPAADGFVTGVRFYKGAGNGGTHVGSLWSSSGQRLAQATFTGETATGWQSVTFTSPVAVQGGQTYVVSYSVPQGHYAVQAHAFAYRGIDAGVLTVEGGFGAEPAGVYANLGTFPSSSYNMSSYFVDALFTSTDTSVPVATQQVPVAGATSVPVDTEISAVFSKPVSGAGATVKNASGTSVAGQSAYDSATRTVSFTPSNPLAAGTTYTVTLSGTDSLGQSVGSGKTWSFTTAQAPGVVGVCPCTLYDDSTMPQIQEVADDAAVTLGTRFTTDVDGTVTGLRFYKGQANTGTHVGTLWAADGTVLATGTFTGESTQGWQTLTFSSPVDITKNTPYVVGYRAPNGRYSATPGGFAAGRSRGPIRVDDAAGAYTYGAGLPNNTVSTEYLVDVVFEKAPVPLAVSWRSPEPGAASVPRDATVTLAVNDPLAHVPTMTVSKVSDGTTVAGSAALGAGDTVATFTPAANLPGGTQLSVTVTGLQSQTGSTLGPQTWTFTTRSASALPEERLLAGVTPDVESASDGSAVEVGMRFVPQRDGEVTGVMFYRGEGNAGTHTGALWSADGTQLATVTFRGESSSGWQTARFAQPVPVTADTEYVVSYLAPQGHYSYTGGYFTAARSVGQLVAPGGTNGRYRYAAGGGFPNQSWGSTSYFVDALFVPDAPTITVQSRTPAAGATDVDRNVVPSLVLSSEVAPGWSMTLTQGGSTVAGSASASTDGTHLRFTPDATLAPDTTFTVTVSGVEGVNGATLPTQTWSFTTKAAAPTTVSLFDGETPQTPATSDGSGVTLGVAFTPSSAGAVTAVRFYKGAGNGGSHTGGVWDASGTLLGTVTFSGETATGWQSATFATPVALQAGQTYVVGYHAPQGHYAASPAYFGQDHTVGPLTAPAAGNGRYGYGGSLALPTSSWNGTNYFVDVVFRPDA